MQSSNNFRQHGPNAVRPPGWVFEPPPPPVRRWAVEDLEPPPSSNGPAALRGEALARALARLVDGG